MAPSPLTSISPPREQDSTTLTSPDTVTVPAIEQVPSVQASPMAEQDDPRKTPSNTETVDRMRHESIIETNDPNLTAPLTDREDRASNIP